MNRNSTKTRRICFERHKFQDEAGRWRLKCEGDGCGYVMDPVRDRWEAHHYVRFADGGTDEQTHPLCKVCHDKITPGDIKAVAKGKRNADRHFGIRRARGFPKPKGARWDWSAGRYVRDE